MAFDAVTYALCKKHTNTKVEEAATIGKTFKTDITVGHITSGTTINASDKTADVIYKMLYGAAGTKISIYYGSSNSIPTDKTGLTELTDQEVDILLSKGKVQTIITGSVAATTEGQYPVFACDSTVNIVSWTAEGAESIEIPFITVDKGTYKLYYLDVKTWSPTGTNYKYTFIGV